MGGCGSGRPGWRASIESTRTVDIPKLRRGGTFAADRIPISVELSYTVDDELVRVTVPITTIPCRYGGLRLYFVARVVAGAAKVIVTRQPGAPRAAGLACQCAMSRSG